MELEIILVIDTEADLNFVNDFCTVHQYDSEKDGTEAEFIKATIIADMEDAVNNYRDQQVKSATSYTDAVGAVS